MRCLLLCVLVVLAGCAGMGGPKTITLQEADLQRLIERRFPLERRLLEVLDVTVDAPHLGLLAERHKLATVFDVQVRDRLFGGSWHAHMALDASLRYEAGDQTLRLLQVRVNEFKLDAGGNPQRAQVERVSTLLAEKVLEDLVVYRLPADKLEQLRQRGLVPGSVAITSRGVEITLAAVTN